MVRSTAQLLLRRCCPDRYTSKFNCLIISQQAERERSKQAVVHCLGAATALTWLVARTCTSLHAPPFAALPRQVPKYRCWMDNLSSTSNCGRKRDTPGILLEVENNRRVYHGAKHSNIPDIFPVLFLSLLTRQRGLQEEFNYVLPI